MTEPTPIPWSITDISDALEIAVASSREETMPLFRSVSTDSRTMETDELFVALTGETFDGHSFIKDLAGRGVRGFVVNREFAASCPEDVTTELARHQGMLFPVPNTLEGLGRLAAFQRRRADVRVVALTGSNGKTTTRKLTAEIFGVSHPALSTRGNFNNEIGLPLTLLRLSKHHHWAVVEMGMSAPGEIARLAGIAKPDISVVTNTAECHLLGLETVENVARAKAEIFSGLAEGGIAVINADDPRYEILHAEAVKYAEPGRIIRFGLKAAADVQALDLQVTRQGTRFTLAWNGRALGTISLPSPAPFMVMNALASASAALAAGLFFEDVKKGIEAFEPVAGRLNLLTSPAGFKVINDTYNANPVSVKGALDTLAILSGTDPSYLVIGDMLELGTGAARFHREIGEHAFRTGVKGIFAYGNHAGDVVGGATDAGLDPERTLTGSREALAQAIMTQLPENAWILVKGSRGMRMETVVTAIMAVKNGE